MLSLLLVYTVNIVLTVSNNTTKSTSSQETNSEEDTDFIFSQLADIPTVALYIVILVLMAIICFVCICLFYCLLKSTKKKRELLEIIRKNTEEIQNMKAMKPNPVHRASEASKSVKDPTSPSAHTVNSVRTATDPPEPKKPSNTNYNPYTFGNNSPHSPSSPGPNPRNPMSFEQLHNNPSVSSATYNYTQSPNNRPMYSRILSQSQKNSMPPHQQHRAVHQPHPIMETTASPYTPYDVPSVASVPTSVPSSVQSPYSGIPTTPPPDRVYGFPAYDDSNAHSPAKPENNELSYTITNNHNIYPNNNAPRYYNNGGRVNFPYNNNQHSPLPPMPHRNHPQQIQMIQPQHVPSNMPSPQTVQPRNLMSVQAVLNKIPSTDQTDTDGDEYTTADEHSGDTDSHSHTSHSRTGSTTETGSHTGSGSGSSVNTHSHSHSHSVSNSEESGDVSTPSPVPQEQTVEEHSNEDTLDVKLNVIVSNISVSGNKEDTNASNIALNGSAFILGGGNNNRTPKSHGESILTFDHEQEPDASRSGMYDGSLLDTPDLDAVHDGHHGTKSTMDTILIHHDAETYGTPTATKTMEDTMIIHDELSKGDGHHFPHTESMTTVRLRATSEDLYDDDGSLLQSPERSCHRQNSTQL